jgi:hypothetical protein
VANVGLENALKKTVAFAADISPAKWKMKQFKNLQNRLITHR